MNTVLEISRSARSRRMLGRAVLALAATVAALTFTGSAQAAFGFSSFSTSFTDGSGVPQTQAGGHDDLTTSFRMTTETSPFGHVLTQGQLRDLEMDLPAGFYGNPQAVPSCSPAEFGDLVTGSCPVSSQVGIAGIVRTAAGAVEQVPVYNIATAPGETAILGFTVASVNVQLDVRTRPDKNHALVARARNINTGFQVYGVDLTLWGVPSDPSHDSLRYPMGWPGGPQYMPSGAPKRPFLSSPTRCDAPLVTTVRSRSWQELDRWATAESTAPARTGCDQLRFEPSLSLQPSSRRAGAPSGYSVELEVPQNEAVNGLGTPTLKNTVVDLPKGVALSPAVAEGAVGCTDEQAALHSVAESSCPEASRIGSVEIQTPILAGPLKGSVYLGQPKSNDSQSGEMFRMFFAASGSGVTIKQEGRVVPDPVTGQLRTIFTESPQQPFSLLKLDFRGGPRAVLTNPGNCGTYTTTASLTPWSAPASGSPAELSDSFAIDQGCGAAAGFTPGLEAGTADPVAGSWSPFSLRVTRPDGQQNLASVEASLPQGLLAKLAGVPLCPDVAATTGDCPAASQVGSATVGAGAGSNPIYVPQPGKAPTGAYLAGPYKGAPYSLVVKVPAQAGPFDLGTVVVRNALHIDPVTTRVASRSDPLPQILQGVPVSYRDVRVELNRPEFTLNPTSCEPTSVGSTIGGVGGVVAHPSTRFQVGDCGALGFSPKVALRLSGAPPRRGANPALRAVVTPPAGQANIGRAAVVLPETEQLEQGHIKTVCTRVQFGADECPAGSVYGHAKAWTPLLDQPLKGPVYLRSNGGERELPDLVADLNGQIHVVLVGYIDTVERRGSPRIRTRFLSVPDAPVTRFVLDMQRGKKSLLANNTNLCKAKPKAEMGLAGQNGKTHEARSQVQVEGCRKAGKANKQSGSDKGEGAKRG